MYSCNVLAFICVKNDILSRELIVYGRIMLKIRRGDLVKKLLSVIMTIPNRSYSNIIQNKLLSQYTSLVFLVLFSFAALSESL